jgi:AmiR/NasT family two-component response regulator
MIPIGRRWCISVRAYRLGQRGWRNPGTRERIGRVTDQQASERTTGDQPSETPRPRVLVAEDEALIRLDLVELLDEQGYQVVGEAADGETAVSLARELAPDLVVLDVKMPKQDGIEAARIIAEERIAPVVMLTAFSQRELVERAQEAGAMAYVVKPFDASDVVPAIEIAMARYAEIRAVEAEVSDLEERLASRKAVDQAKGLLQQQFGMSEPEAFRWIQKSAMDMRKSMREVAEGVIDLAQKNKKK